MKRGQDGVANSGGTGTGKPSGTANASTQCVLKFLAPEALAAAILGKGGSAIAAMRQSCQAKLALTEKGNVYPQTGCRVLTAQAGTEESLNEVSRQVVARLAELGKGGAAASEAPGQEGQLQLRTLVPRAAVGGFIGKGGAVIKQIRETSGAKILISEPAGSGPGADQLITVWGTAQALECVMAEINKQIQQLNTEPWFSSWASTASVGNPFGAYQGGGYSSGGIQGPVRGSIRTREPASAAGNSAAFNSPEIDTMVRVAQGLPPYVMEDSRGFALSCVVPSRLVGGLIGRGGSGTKEVQMLTGAKIGVREIPDNPDSRSLNITGPLPSACAAYMLMMKRYLDAEAQLSGPGGQGGPW